MVLFVLSLIFVFIKLFYYQDFSVFNNIYLVAVIMLC